MTLEAHNKILEQLLLANEQPERSKLLEQLREDYTKISGDLTTAQSEQERLKKENETFSRVNSDLFLKVGQIDKSLESLENEVSQEDEPPEKLRYEDLVMNQFDMMEE